jgi:hypothetical protein
MSAFKPSKNLSRVTATRALVLVSIFLFGAGPCLAGPVGVKPITKSLPQSDLYPQQIVPGLREQQLKMWYDKNHAPLKERHTDSDLRSHDKGKNLIIHESITKDPPPPINNNNKRPNCSSMPDSLMPSDHDCGVASAIKSRGEDK